MKIMMIGDVYGRTGRNALATHLPELRKQYAPDAVIVNADNASNGNGANPATIKELYEMGIDLLTGGDHIWDQRESLTHLDRSPWILRPLNYPNGTIGKGFHVLEVGKKKLLVIHALGRVFIEKKSENPFLAIDALLQKYALKKDVDAIVVDFHAEATSEKNAMGLYLDGRVSGVVGTHTHVQTADARIMPKGTAYITDIGMTGDQSGVIGADAKAPLQLFISGFSANRIQPGEGEGSVCGVVMTIDDATGLASAIEAFHKGGVLAR
jgi:metallophosphoesterase (TIGR00282 family)